MKKLFLTVVIALLTWGFTGMAQNLDAPINNDPNVVIGKLENGITYYIRANKKPENRVEFRLAVNAGSNQENDDQQGLAHFTEHMAFNGMEGFPGNEIVSELQKIGVSFGGGLNAYTSFDETVYMIQMPSDKQEYLDMGLSILKGWAHGLLMDGEEIDKERGIIAEEYRMGLGASDRMRKEWWPVVFKDSRYANRMPIGLIEIINNFDHKLIRSFYHDWYRTDLQAVIVVGDVDVAKMEEQIKATFGKIKPVKNPRVKETYPIGLNTTPLVSICTDKEAMGSQVMLLRKYPHFVMKTVGDYRTEMAYTLYNMMYDSRFSEMLQDPKCPFLGAATQYGHFIGNTDAYVSEASCKEGQIAQSIEVLLKEDYRVLQYGFLESELVRAKKELLYQYEIDANEVDKTESATFASQYVANFLQKDPIPGAKRVYNNYAKKYLDGITLEEINALAKKWITPENFVAVVMAPEKEGVKVPTEAEVLAIINNKELAKVTPYVDTYKEQEVIDVEKLKPGVITESKELPQIDAKEVTLSNGIKVILKKTDYKQEEILFNAKSKGGFSLYYECDLASLNFASSMIDRAGIGELNYNSLEKKMKGKKLGLTPYISALEEGFTGETTPKDLEFFCQYLNAFFTNPRYDSTVYDLVIDMYLEQIKMMNANPMYKLFGSFLDAIVQNDPYQSSGLTWSEEFVKSADYARAFQLYQQRFANPADFTFTFVGNFDEAIMNQYLEKYIASLPTTKEFENFKGDVLKDFPEKSVRDNVYAGTEEQSWVGLGINKNYEWTLENNMILNCIEGALDIELIETIREKMSGVYSPMLQMSYDKYPEPSYTTLVLFSCAPDNTDKLANAVIKLLKEFQTNGPKPETLSKVKENLIRSQETSLKTNKMWLSYISNKYFNNDDINSINTFNDRVNAVTNDMIVKFMKENFDIDHNVRVDLYPESMKK